MRVLVVDDDELVIRLVQQALTGLCETDTAGDGVQAREILEKALPDRLLLDLMMPKMTGMELYAWIEQTCPALLEHTTVMTGGGPAAMRFLQTHSCRHIFKPFERSELLDALRIDAKA